ncbi:hypothetical protein N9V17_00565 [Candidatus Poseidoniales archaeon]|nr:hypothetical protein [Candidatus Poseidoniales archaeon]
MSGQDPPRKLVFSTIPVDQLKTYKAHWDKDSTSILEIKRTTGARISSTETIELGSDEMPVSILPGSLHSYSIKMDRNQQYSVTRKIPRNLEGYENAPLPPSNSYTSPSATLGMEDAKFLIESIRFVQNYMNELHKRILGDNINDKIHLAVPLSLRQALIAIETVFSESLTEGLAELRTGVTSLKKYLGSRKSDLRVLLSELEKAMDTSSELPATPKQGHEDIGEASFTLPYFNQEDWEQGHGRVSEQYKRFLNSRTPTEFNREIVNQLLENLIFDTIIHNRDNWQKSKTVDAQSEDYPTLEFRLTQLPSELQKKYIEIGDKLQPVKTALGDLKEKGLGDVDTIQYSLDECEELRMFLDEIKEANLLKFVTKSPGQLEKQIQQIVRKHELSSVMEEELRKDFPGLYRRLNEIPDRKARAVKIDQAYNSLTSVRMNFEQIEQYIKDARDLIAQKATLKDVATIRENANERIQQHRSDVKRDKDEKQTVDDLTTSSNSKLAEIDEWYQELKSSLAGNNDRDALLWIGLGQAGGQILRECLTYCLQNLADARCSALLTALGITSEDKKTILNNMKRIHSDSRSEKAKAEHKLKHIFDKKAHVLAINLGEEIDKLANSSQPSYYLWGDMYKSDSTSQTVRTKRNILKLIENGKGAGGATGIGRAYGFRFHSDISEAMRDVGKKSNRHPQHIVITHSLSGGSGSGMVLPVLEQARRTFGDEPVIWVISVGEGSTEKKHTAKINTPFILSDILQAAYDGIHVIYEPITLGDVRKFIRDVGYHLEKMESSARTLLSILGTEVPDNKSVYEPLFKLLKRNNSRSNEMMTNIIESLDSLQSMTLSRSNNGIREVDKNKIYSDRKQITTTHDSYSLFEILKEMLPSNADESTLFSDWCEEENLDGTRDAVEFWRNWRTAIQDPLTIHLRGREKSAITKSDDGKSQSQTHFEPDLTGDQLRQLIFRLYSETGVQRNEKDVPHVSTKQGLDTLYQVFEDILVDGDPKNLIKKLEESVNEYGRSLDAYNSALLRMDRHILSLSGSGKDSGIKSIVVSNRHLEKGVEQTGEISVSSEAYTVFNSVIFDLMLNIIGPRLPTEPGVYITTDAEEYDHNDMLNSTKPPMIVGLLNQRDSASLSEPVTVGGQEARLQYPPKFEDLLLTILSSEYLNEGANDVVENIAFVEYSDGDAKFQRMFTAMFGSRFKYLLETDPFTTLTIGEKAENQINVFSEKLIRMWDYSDDNVLGYVKTQRESLATNNGLSGLHIANLIRWLGLIAKPQFSRFTSKKTQEKRIEKLLDREGSIWNLLEDIPRKFDIDFLTKSSALQYYRDYGTQPNMQLLYKIFPKMGIFNAQSLRALGPAYINSFLPLAMLQSDEVKKYIQETNYPIPDEDHFKTDNQPDPEEFKEFISSTWDYLNTDHTMKLNGLVNYDEHYELVDWFNPMLDSIDLRMKIERVGEETSVFLGLHPRLERYLSVVRDIPSEPEHQYLPARSTSASMARYLYADGEEHMLDMTSNLKLRTGIAAPNFIMGLDLLKQLRFTNLLPDELRLSFPTLLRVLLLTPDSSKDAMNRLESHLKSAGVDIDSIENYFSQILDENKFPPMKSYNVPELYCEFIQILVLRLHSIRPLIDFFLKNRPTRWTSNDDAAMNYLVNSILVEEIIADDPSAVRDLYGNDKASIPNLKEWFQVVINDVVKQIESDELDDKDIAGDTPEATAVSNLNPAVLKIKQLFYDLVTVTSEAYHQAEYFQNDGKDSRNVHFEMTGFSDRLLGQPSGLLLMMHDRNVNLPMNIIKQNARSSLEHFLSDFANPKEFSTASDFGPSSFMTMVFTQAPAADIADQFQELMINEQNGLGGNNPDWPIVESKLHPYMLLYNLLWLSVSVIGKWSMRNNKVYSRRFQIPVRVIQKHYQSPQEVYEKKKTIEQNKSDFPGEITMPPSDNRAYDGTLKKKSTVSTNRNIIRLLGLMALRYEHVCKAKNGQESALWSKSGLDEAQYKELVKSFSKSDYEVDWEHLMAPTDLKNEQAQKISTRKRWSRGKHSKPTNGTKPDTAEARARAWFKAYANWINYQPPGETHNGSVSESNLFTVGDSIPNLRPETSPTPVPEVSATTEASITPELSQDENIDSSEDSLF